MARSLHAGYVEVDGKRSFAVGSTGGPLGGKPGLPSVNAGLWKAILLRQARQCPLSLSRRTTQNAGKRDAGYTMYLLLLAQRLLIPDIQPIRGEASMSFADQPVEQLQYDFGGTFAATFPSSMDSR